MIKRFAIRFVLAVNRIKSIIESIIESTENDANCRLTKEQV